MNAIPFTQQQPGEMRAVLPGDAGNQRDASSSQFPQRLHTTVCENPDDWKGFLYVEGPRGCIGRRWRRLGRSGRGRRWEAKRRSIYRSNHPTGTSGFLTGRANIHGIRAWRRRERRPCPPGALPRRGNCLRGNWPGESPALRPAEMSCLPGSRQLRHFDIGDVGDAARKIIRHFMLDDADLHIVGNAAKNLAARIG